jgi:hypothetical protein
MHQPVQVYRLTLEGPWYEHQKSFTDLKSVYDFINNDVIMLGPGERLIVTELENGYTEVIANNGFGDPEKVCANWLKDGF